MTRVEPCTCGGAISAPSREFIPAAVYAHNRTVSHRLWRLNNEMGYDPTILAEKLPDGTTYRDPRRPTTVDDPVDPVQGDGGTSADEGAA